MSWAKNDQVRAAGFSPDGKTLYVTGFIRQTADFDGDGNADASAAVMAIGELFFSLYELRD